MKKNGFRMGFGIALLAILVALFAAYACVPDPGDECDETLQPGDDRQCSVGSDTYYVYAPANYDPNTPTALIVDAHGAMETAEEHAGIDTEFCATGMCWPGKGSGWRLEADMPGGGFIVITPQGSNNTWSSSDEDFILEAVSHVKTIANIDPDKVYISGISNGAALTYWVGCPNTDVFAGMAPVSGGADCDRIDRAIPVITFDAEPDFAYDTAVSASDTMVDLNNCSSGPTTWLTVDSTYNEPVCRNDPFSTNPTLVPCSSITPAIEPTVCKRWYDCDRNVEVVFCDVAPSNLHGDGNEDSDAHILYGNNSHLNLPSLAWRFFQSIEIDDSNSSSSGGNTGGCN